MRFIIALFALFCLANCEQLLTQPKFTGSLKRFSVDLLKQLKYKDENIVYSPFGLAAVAGICLSGAQNESKTELFKLLHMNDYADKHTEVDVKFQKVLNSLNEMQSKGRNATAEVASLVLTSESLPDLPPTYVNKLKTYYEASFGKEDFTKQQEVKNKINEFVKGKTHELIPQVLKEPLSADTVFTLINTVYFKGYWVFPMSPGFDSTFYNNDKTESKVKMMHLEPKTLNYLDDPNIKVRVLELPYNGNISMYIFLPRERHGLADINEMLISDQLPEANLELTPTLVRVSLPKFEFEHKIDLTEVFPKLGVNMKNVLKGLDSRLVVDTALHQAKIKTDSTGTEAAAATVIAGVPLSAPIYPKPPIDFVCDHPFNFAIRDNVNDIDLFAGVVNKFN